MTQNPFEALEPGLRAAPSRTHEAANPPTPAEKKKKKHAKTGAFSPRSERRICACPRCCPGSSASSCGSSARSPAPADRQQVRFPPAEARRGRTRPCSRGRRGLLREKSKRVRRRWRRRKKRRTIQDVSIGTDPLFCTSSSVCGCQRRGEAEQSVALFYFFFLSSQQLLRAAAVGMSLFAAG